MTKEEIKEHYRDIFIRVFGRWETEQHPSHVLVVVKDEDVLGFASGYYSHPNTFHIQYCGMTPERRGRGFFKLYRQIEIAFPAKLYTACIPNDNTVPQRCLLKEGYKVLGVRQHEGVLFVEFIKEK